MKNKNEEYEVIYLNLDKGFDYFIQQNLYKLFSQVTDNPKGERAPQDNFKPNEPKRA